MIIFFRSVMLITLLLSHFIIIIIGQSTATTNINNTVVVATFSTPNQAINITHVTYDPLHDTVYVGATNSLYQLNGSDLSVQYEQITGPVLDHPSCGITECHGYEDYMKLTQSINKILVIDYRNEKLLTCFSTKQGACRRYQLNNISSNKEDLISMAVAANDDNSSTYAFIAPSRYQTYEPTTTNTKQQSLSTQIKNDAQQVLYVGTTYTKVGQSRDLLVPAIGTRILDNGPNLLKLYENSFLDSARIDINSHLRDYFLVNYLYGFASSNYIYFITLQKKATSRDYEELGYHTRLARICITDSSYNSYTEVDLKCVAPASNKRSTKQQQQEQDIANEYPLLQDAILVDAGSSLLQSLNQNDHHHHHSPLLSINPFFSTHGGPTAGGASAAVGSDEGKVLLGVFSTAKDNSQHPGDHSALCAFSLSQIEDKFNDNIHNCYTGKMSSRNMEYIAGNVQECPRSGQGGNVVNFCHETLKINGTLPIISEAAIQFPNTTLTAITATSAINTNIKNIYSTQLANELIYAMNINISNPSHSSSSKQKNQDNNDIKLTSNYFSQQASHISNLQTPNTVAFLGTSSGHLKKILINNASKAVEFEQIQVNPSGSAILGDLHLHSSGRFLIAATTHNVTRIPIESCAQYSSCRECSQSANPYCGWCSLKRSCTTKSDCPAPPELAATPARPKLSGQQASATSSSRWISNEPGKCVDLQAIVPDKMPITSMGKIELHIERLPPAQGYRCLFNQRDQTPATPTRFGLSCPLPKLASRPQIEPGRDHALVEVSLRSIETNTDFLTGRITFFECQLHTTCKDCLSTNWACNWCSNENACLYNTSKCEPPTSSFRGRELVASALAPPGRQMTRASNAILASSSNLISQVGQCPTFDLRDKQDILVADGSERQLSIRVKNMPQIKGPIQCLVEIESSRIQLKARLEEDRLICDNASYSYSAEVGLLSAQLVVIHSDNNLLIDRANLTLYKCHLLGAHLSRPDCSLCKRIDSPFNCVWCSNSCRHKSRCSAQAGDLISQCPAPRIDSVTPLSGPTYGGTRVTIEGSNLGQSFEEIEHLVRIGDSTCRPLESEYRPSTRIVCITSPLMGAQQQNSINNNNNSNQWPYPNTNTNDPMAASNQVQAWSAPIVVGNRAGFSLVVPKFTFKSIFLRDHQPRYGPQSGGTRLTLTGTNLNVGSQVLVFLDELPCSVESQSISSEQIICKTGASRQASRSIRQLKLVIDDAQIVRDGPVFFYTQDPIITKVTPLRSYLAGGRPINVFGANLTSVQAPKMAILDPVSGRKLNESLCLLHDESRMQCPSPTLNLDGRHWTSTATGGSDNNTVNYNNNNNEWTEREYDPNSASSSNNNNNWPLAPSNGHNSLSLEEGALKFRVAFIMDDVFKLHSIINDKQPAIEIAYTADPKLYPFSTNEYKAAAAQEVASSSFTLVGVGGPIESWQQQSADSQGNAPSSMNQMNAGRLFQLEPDTYLIGAQDPVLILHGEHLRTAVSDYEITVTIGSDLCNFTQLTQTKLICSVSLDRIATPTDEEGRPSARQLPLVVVRIGFNLRFELGYIQYHPELIEQIFRNIANNSPNGHQDLAYMRSSGPFPPENYMPRESGSISNERFLHRLGSIIFTVFMGAIYLALGALACLLVYNSLNYVNSIKSKCQLRSQYKRVANRIESIEKSVRAECRLASMALQSDLNELVTHIQLSGCPVLPVKQFIMRLFFPGITNHPLSRSSSASSTSKNTIMANYQASYQVAENFSTDFPRITANTLTLERPLGSADSPTDHFERLLSNKCFLINFVNCLERQSSFTIRDKVNVASLLMICLLDKPDYMLDILRTLLLQLVQKSVSRSRNIMKNNQNNTSLFYHEHDYHHDDQEHATHCRSTPYTTGSRKTGSGGLTARGLLSRARGAAGGQASSLSKVVSGSASSLLASTQVAAQMLLSRLNAPAAKQPTSNGLWFEGHQPTSKPTNNQQLNYPKPTITNQQHQRYLAHHTMGNLHGTTKQGAQQQQHHHCLSTTTFNQRPTHQNMSHSNQQRACSTLAHLKSTTTNLSSSDNSQLDSTSNNQCFQQHLMLRRTESVVEKMLTNWLALNMYDYFHGPTGEALYLMFEALKHQLDRGPVDSITGDAYYSLNGSKLLREPNIQYEPVNLYMIVDASIFQPTADNNFQRQQQQQQQQQQLFIQDPDPANDIMFSSTTTATSNTITLTVRVIDCDTISQVKAKALHALYRNSPWSTRVKLEDVELSLRLNQDSLVENSTSAQCVNLIPLEDEDSRSLMDFNGKRRLNTLRHYGVVDQAIMTLTRRRHANNTQSSGNNINNSTSDSNPYSEILYGPMTATATPTNDLSQSSVVNNATKQHQTAQRNVMLYHLTTTNNNHRGSNLDKQHETNQRSNCNNNTSSYLHSEQSSPGSQSPSMLLLANQINNNNQLPASALHTNNNQHQYLYHPPSSSSSCTSSSNGGPIGPLDSSQLVFPASSLTSSVNATNQLLASNHARIQVINNSNDQQPIYCQIESVSAPSQHGVNQQPEGAYYCQINPSTLAQQHTNHPHQLLQLQQLQSRNNNSTTQQSQLSNNNDTATELEQNIYLSRMLASKGTVQIYIDNFFKTILNGKPTQATQTTSNLINSNPSNGPGSSFPMAVKWLFDLLDKAALENGITDPSVVHAWKSNAFLLRFWVNLVKNPQYILDVDKSITLDATLSVVAQTLMDSCTIDVPPYPHHQPHEASPFTTSSGSYSIFSSSSSSPTLSHSISSSTTSNMNHNHTNHQTMDKMIFANDMPRYNSMVKRFYQDIGLMKPVNDQQLVRNITNRTIITASNDNKKLFDTRLALKELFVYAVNYGVEIMASLNNELACQQQGLPTDLENCFRAFAFFESFK